MEKLLKKIQIITHSAIDSSGKKHTIYEYREIEQYPHPNIVSVECNQYWQLECGQQVQKIGYRRYKVLDTGNILMGREEV